MSFGGVEGSGMGRFGGKAGSHEFTELRWITVQTAIRSERPRPWSTRFAKGLASNSLHRKVAEVSELRRGGLELSGSPLRTSACSAPLR